MKNNWIEILNEYEPPKIDENKKSQSMEKLKLEIENTNIKVKENYFKKILKLISFIDKKLLIVQFILLIFGLFVVANSTSFKSSRLLLSLVMPVLAFVQITEFEKSFKHNMYEIEMSCKINLKELISIKMIFLSVINICIMTIFVLSMNIKFQCEIYLLNIYFLVPFLITNVINIQILKLFKNKSNDLINIIISLFINASIFILNEKLPNIYEKSSILLWIAILIVVTINLAKIIYQFKTDEVDYIWNLQ